MSKSLASLRHERSKKDFPGLKLDGDEFVQLVFGRARANLLFLWGAIGVATALVLLIFFLIILAQPVLNPLGTSFVFVLLALILGAAILGSLLAYMIHRGNRLFITNKRFILSSVRFPMVRSEHSTELSDVRNVSFSEDSMFLQLLHYGTLKLATAKSVYEFHDAQISQDELSAISEAVSLASPAEGNRAFGAVSPSEDFQTLKI